MWDWSNEAREALTANELRLWVDAIPGLWCPTCLLPSAVKFVVKRDPSDPAEGMRKRQCLNDSTHQIPEDD